MAELIRRSRARSDSSGRGPASWGWVTLVCSRVERIPVFYGPRLDPAARTPPNRCPDAPRSALSPAPEESVLRDGPTSLGSWGLAIVAALESRGVDPLPLLGTVGLSLEALSDPGRRHGLAVTTRLWRLSVKAT